MREPLAAPVPAPTSASGADPAPCPPLPIRTLTVELTASCNLSCSYCYQVLKPRRRMSWDTLRAGVDQLLASPLGDRKLLFYGGEPLLELPLIERAVAYLAGRAPRRRPVRLSLITNGTLLGPEAAAFLAAHRVHTQLSFDGVPAAQAERGARTFPVLDALLDRLRASHPGYYRRDLRVAVTVTARTLPWLAASVEYFLAKDVRCLAVAPAITHQPEWKLEHIADLDRELGRVFRASLRHYRRTGRVPLELLRRAPGPPPPGGPRNVCGLTEGQSLTIDADGQVHGCQTLASATSGGVEPMLGRIAEDLRLGDLRAPELADRHRRFRHRAGETRLFTDHQWKHSGYGRCISCAYLASCPICPVSIANIPGNQDPDRVPDFACAFHLVSSRYRLRFPPTVDVRWRRRRRPGRPGVARLVATAVAEPAR